MRTDKFGPRAVKSVLMGYGTTQKAYKLYDLQNKVFFITRVVVFNESIFPFQTHCIDDIQDIILSNEASDLPVRFDDLDCIDDPIDNAAHAFDIDLEDHHQQDQPTIDDSILSSNRRQSTRTSRPPLWQKDFVTTFKSKSRSNCLYSLENNIDYINLSSSYQCYIANLSVDTEPKFYHQASKVKIWVEAMEEEIQALEDNKTWEVVTLPVGKRL